MAISKCLTCGNDFYVRPAALSKGLNKFCSRECKIKTNNPIVNCLICNKPFKTYPCRIKINKGKFCSQKCLGIYKSIYNIGCKNHRWKGGEIEKKCLICGKIFSICRAAEKIGEGKTCSRKCAAIWKSQTRSGENCPRWQGGVTPKNTIIRNSREFKEWRNKVFKRDNYTCQHCGQYNGYLHAHHEFSFTKFPELRFNVDNGWTLCASCHGKVHNRNLSMKKRVG